MGDFYETFGQDAIVASNVLGIILTARNNGSSKIELAGFPHHSVGNYLPKLVKAGHRVAVCDQLEAPIKGKKIVKRGVVELVTPGVALTDQLLENKGNNFLAAINFSKISSGIAFLDISTGEFYVAKEILNISRNLSMIMHHQKSYTLEIKTFFFKKIFPPRLILID